MKILKGIFFGAIITPISSLVFVVTSLAFTSPTIFGPTSITEILLITLTYSIVAIFFVALVLAAVATPLFIMLNIFKLDNIYTCVIFSLAPTILTGIGAFSEGSLAEGLYSALFFGWVSLVAGLTFWYHACEDD